MGRAAPCAEGGQADDPDETAFLMCAMLLLTQDVRVWLCRPSAVFVLRVAAPPAPPWRSRLPLHFHTIR